MIMEIPEMLSVFYRPANGTLPGDRARNTQPSNLTGTWEEKFFKSGGSEAPEDGFLSARWK
jgi:hypothetical protein